MIQWTKLTNFSAIQSKYRSLLIRVYVTLTLTVVSAVLGFCFYTASSARISLPPLLTLLVMFSLIFYLKITGVTAESDDRDEHERQEQESANDDGDDSDHEQFIIAENENSRSNYSGNGDHNSWMEHYFSRRNWILYLFGFINGLHLSPLISHIVAMSDDAVDVGSAAFGDSSSSLSLFVIKYGTPLLALLATCLIFASFSAFSLLTKRRSMLYLGGFLSSALSILVLFSMFSLLFGFGGASGAGGGGQWLSQMVMLYGGLMLFVGFVIFDTQIMIEKLHAGYRDTVNLSLELFIDFVGIFVRILIILAKKNNRRK